MILDPIYDQIKERTAEDKYILGGMDYKIFVIL